MVFDFDLRLFCENLKATKPPYECPAPGCGRVYKTYIGIQFHLFNYDHENPDGKSSSTPGSSDRSKQQDASKKGHHRQVRHPSSPDRVNEDEPEHELSSSSLSPHNVSAKSQRVVEVTLDGRVHRIDVYEPMNVTVRKSQPPVPASSDSADKKLSDVVACTTLSDKTVLDEPPRGDAVIGDTVPVAVVAPECSSFTADAAVVTNEFLETGSNHYIADMPTENVVAFVSDTEKVKGSCVVEACSDVDNDDIGKTTLTAGTADNCFLQPSDCPPPDSSAVNSNSSSISCNSIVHNGVVDEMKTEADHEEPEKPSTEFVDKNTSCFNDTTIPVSLSELVHTDVSTTCAEAAECDTVQSCNPLSTSTSVVSKSVPTKLSLPSAEFKILSDYMRPPKIAAAAQRPEYYKFTERTTDELDVVVEYDMDEEVIHCFS